VITSEKANHHYYIVGFDFTFALQALRYVATLIICFLVNTFITSANKFVNFDLSNVVLHVFFYKESYASV